MKTILLYEQDSFIKEFSANVLECRPAKEGYYVILDQTGFFPEGGGQTADTGVLCWDAECSDENLTMDESIDRATDGSGDTYRSITVVRVLEVQEVDGEILHQTDGPLPVGSKIIGTLNWKERFSKMQHHSGEHIVSGLVHRHFGFNNVGFHLGSQVVTLDFDGVMTKEQLRQIEWEANEAVAADLPILVTYPTKEELTKLTYRSKIEIEGQVRIVEISGYDVCACCAPHLHTTGQIGMIKLVNMQHFRGGVRVYMLCGFAALADYNQKEDSVRAISQSLSAREDLIADAVEKLKQEIYRQKGENMALANALLEYKVAAVAPGTERAVLIEHGLEGNQPRELVNKLLDKDVKVAWVFSGNDTDGYRYVVGSRSQDVRVLAKEMNEVLHGRGGGKPEMVQGSVACKRTEIVSFLHV